LAAESSSTNLPQPSKSLRDTNRHAYQQRPLPKPPSAELPTALDTPANDITSNDGASNRSASTRFSTASTTSMASIAPSLRDLMDKDGGLDFLDGTEVGEVKVGRRVAQTPKMVSYGPDEVGHGSERPESAVNGGRNCRAMDDGVAGGDYVEDKAREEGSAQESGPGSALWSPLGVLRRLSLGSPTRARAPTGSAGLPEGGSRRDDNHYDDSDRQGVVEKRMDPWM
jgi:hypothetical protein